MITNRQTITYAGLSFVLEPLTDATGPLRLVWLHGWGQSRESLRSLANQLLPLGECWLLDAPGHGEAPIAAKESDVSPAAMANALATWLATLPPCPTIIIGHSMGFRIALHAAKQPFSNLRGIVALAGAGVPKPLPFSKALRRRGIRLLMKVGHAVKPYLGESLLNHLRQRFAGTDFLRCPHQLRPMFMQVVRDDATPFLGKIQIPALLIYGADDEDTPTTMGKRMARKLQQAQLHVLPGLNHFTLLTNGRHAVGSLIETWIKTLR